jgi:mannosyltransferase
VRQGAFLMQPIVQRPAADSVTTPENVPRRRMLASLTWAGPAVVTGVLGAAGIGVPMLWRDELATWSAASRTVPQLWTMVQHIDAVLGLYYLGLHFWMGAFGDSATAMRAPSVIAMTGAAAVVALAGRRLGGTAAGLASGLCFAFIPSVSRYAQEARPYAFATFFAALATLLLLRALDRPGWRRWAVYALAIAAVGACNLVALCVTAGHAVAVAADWHQRASGRARVLTGFCLSVIAGAAVDTPIILEGQRQAQTQIGSLQRPAFGELIGTQGSLWPELFCSVAVAVAVIAVAVMSPWLASARRAAVCSLAGGLLPVIVVWVLSQGPSSYWTVRYLLFTVPAWAVAAGLGIAGSGQRLARLRLPARRLAGPWPSARLLAGCAAASVSVVLPGLLGLHDQQAIRQPEAHNWWMYPAGVGSGAADYQGAAEVIAARERPGDGIVFQVGDDNHWQVGTGVVYYLKGALLPTLVFQTRTPAQAGSLRPAECARAAQCLARLRARPRLWVVYVNHLVPGNDRDPFSAIPPAQAAAMHEARYRTVARYEADGITVALLAARR